MATTKTLSVEEQNTARRLAKARQNANARAAAARRRVAGMSEFSMAEALSDRRKAAVRRNREVQTAERLLQRVRNEPVVSLSSDDYANFNRLCYLVISAAKAAPERFNWNRDWKETGRLNMQLQK